EGHMQFMPCTWVGWSHPSCSELGRGDIPEEVKTDPEAIRSYGGYGLDADGDGRADPFSLSDSLYNAASYLSRTGAAEGELEQAVFLYNHSERYVEEVMSFYRDYEQRSDEITGK